MPSIHESTAQVESKRQKKELSSKIYSFTTWINNTKNTYKFKIYKAEEDVIIRADDGMILGSGKAMDYEIITMKPGDTEVLPSRYDNSIRKIDLSGKVVGGLCPYLSIVDELITPQFSDAVDYVKQEEIAAIEKFIKDAQQKELYLAAKRTNKQYEEDQKKAK